MIKRPMAAFIHHNNHCSKWKPINYAPEVKERTTNNIPRAKAVKQKDKLYELEIIQEDEYLGKVKVHYIGYGSEEDEWRDRSDIIIRLTLLFLVLDNFLQTFSVSVVVVRSPFELM